jgi:hypothetical protein
VDMFRYPTVGTLAAALQRTGPVTVELPVAELAQRRRAGLTSQARARRAGRAAGT